ncbi:hypothetical protein [Micromonospora sp. NPDC049679]|uniref:hypothetical protein n=1 Tax=Micromonospora sp. NPDC049679 TaxID=3155920 RepID=UPI0033D1FBA8
MKLSDPTSRKKEKDYDQSDVEHLLRKRPWRSYDEMIGWLEQEGDEDRRFTPGEVARMVQDLSRLKERKAQFTTDPERLCREMKG